MDLKARLVQQALLQCQAHPRLAQDLTAAEFQATVSTPFRRRVIAEAMRLFKKKGYKPVQTKAMTFDDHVQLVRNSAKLRTEKQIDHLIATIQRETVGYRKSFILLVLMMTPPWDEEVGLVHIKTSQPQLYRPPHLRRAQSTPEAQRGLPQPPLLKRLSTGNRFDSLRDEE